MRRIPVLATLVLGIALQACQESSSTSSPAESEGLGGISLGFAARTLDTLRQDSDSLLVTLAGTRDTIRSLSRLGDTLRFDGLRTGSWSLSAEVFASDSGLRERTWEGASSVWVQAGRTARTSLILRRATGSLVVDIRLDDGPDSIYVDSCWMGGADTSCGPAPSHDTDGQVPDDTASTEFRHGLGLPLTPFIPASWQVDSMPWVVAPTSRFFERFFWSAPRILEWSSTKSFLEVRVFVPGANTIPWAAIVEDDSCEVPLACPLRVKVSAKIPEGGVVDSFALRAATLRVDLAAYPQARTKGVILSDESSNVFLVRGLLGDVLGACDRPVGPGLVTCRDAASAGVVYRKAP